MRSFIAALLLCSITTLAVREAQGGTVDPPLKIKTTKLDHSEVSGLVTSYDKDGMEVMDLQKKTTKIAWEDFQPGTAVNLFAQVTRNKGTADEWEDLGKTLLTVPGGKGPAANAFRRALALDPKRKDEIAQIQKDAALHPVTATRPFGTEPPLMTGQGSTTQPLQPGQPGYEPTDPNKPIVGPQQVGAVDAAAWGKQTPEDTQAAIARLKQFAAEAQQKLGVRLTPYETQYFLFYTDLSQQDATKWVGLLDRMYARMSELFAVPKNENIWRGKALVFVFSREQDYLNFEMKSHATMAAGTAGMCHQFGNGDVHIAFYRQPNDMDFAHVLVHETTHGFLHRYRSAVTIPSWANEGLAETIANLMVPQPGMAMSATADAKNDLLNKKSLGKFFETDHIVFWQYAVSRTLTEFMLKQSKQGYVDFINGVKDGMTVDDALKQKYGVTKDQLVDAYGRSMGVQGLKAE